MKIYISDTNILIDLADVELLDEFSQLDVELYTTDFVIAELEDGDQKGKIESIIAEGFLNVIGTGSDEIEKLFGMMSDNNGLSLEDCSVWYQAKKKNGKPRIHKIRTSSH